MEGVKGGKWDICNNMKIKREKKKKLKIKKRKRKIWTQNTHAQLENNVRHTGRRHPHAQVMHLQAKEQQVLPANPGTLKKKAKTPP